MSEPEYIERGLGRNDISLDAFRHQLAEMAGVEYRDDISEHFWRRGFMPERAAQEIDRTLRLKIRREITKKPWIEFESFHSYLAVFGLWWVFMLWLTSMKTMMECAFWFLTLGAGLGVLFFMIALGQRMILGTAARLDAKKKFAEYLKEKP
jgi:hypothetical protein